MLDNTPDPSPRPLRRRLAVGLRRARRRARRAARAVWRRKGVLALALALAVAVPVGVFAAWAWHVASGLDLERVHEASFIYAAGQPLTAGVSVEAIGPGRDPAPPAVPGGDRDAAPGRAVPAYRRLVGHLPPRARRPAGPPGLVPDPRRARGRPRSPRSSTPPAAAGWMASSWSRRCSAASPTPSASSGGRCAWAAVPPPLTSGRPRGRGSPLLRPPAGWTSGRWCARSG